MSDNARWTDDDLRRFDTRIVCTYCGYDFGLASQYVGSNHHDCAGPRIEAAILAERQRWIAALREVVEWSRSGSGDFETPPDPAHTLLDRLADRMEKP